MEPETRERRGWLRRNWLWLVPTAGCGGGLAAIGIAVVAIGFVAVTAIKHADAYKEAVARAQQSAPLTAALGSPIRPGIFIQGNVRITGQSGSASFSIPLSGPRGKATLTVLAYKSGGAWHFAKLDAFIPATGQHIDLSNDEDARRADRPPELEQSPTPSAPTSGAESDW